MKDVTLRQMQYFVAVLDHGSVGAGAAACHVSQATVSAALSQLERIIGADLLVRGPARRAQPTQAGLVFAARARDILASVDEATDAVDEARESLRGPLAVGCIHTASPRFLPGLVEAVTLAWPEVQLTLLEATPWEIQERLATGRLDIGILYARQVRRTDLEQHHVANVELHVVLPADSPLARQPAVSLRDLTALPVIMLDIPPTQELLLERIHAMGLDVSVRWRSSSPETIRSLVARGLGFALVNAVPHGSVRSFEGLDVVYRPIREQVFENSAVALTATGRHRPRRVNAAIDVLRRVAAETDPRGW